MIRPGVRGWSAALDDDISPARDDDETDMDASAPLDTTLGRLGLIAAALLAAAAVLAERPRLRAAAMAGALVLTPVLLIAEIYDTDQFRTLRDRPAFTAALVAVALVALAGARVPDGAPAARCCRCSRSARCRSGSRSRAPGQTANLLVPLYGVIAAGALAQMPALFAGRRPAGTHERPPGALALVLLALRRALRAPGRLRRRRRASPCSRSSSSTSRSRCSSACSCGSSGRASY